MSESDELQSRPRGSIWQRVRGPFRQRLSSFNWRRALWISGCLVALIAVLGFFAAPPLVRSVLQEQASKALGRQVSVAHVRINPFALSVTLEGLRIAEQDGKSTFVSLDSIYANAELSSIFRRGLVLSALQIRKPQLHIARLGENRFNFSDIIERFAAQPKEPSEPPRFALNNIEIDDGRIDFDDVAVGQKHVIDSFTLGLPFVSSMPSQVEILVRPHLETNVNGKPFALQGELKPFADRREASLDLQLEGFDLVRYLGYMPVALPVKIQQATLDAKLECVWIEHDKGEPSFSLRGDLALSGVRVTERDDKALLGFRRLQLGLQDIQPLVNPMRIALRSMTWVEPELSLHRFADGSLNVQHLGQATRAASPTPAAASAPIARASPASPHVTVGEIVLQRGRIHVSDEAVEGGFKTDIAPIELRVQGFDLAGKRDATLKADMQVESSGKLSVQGNFNAAQLTADVRLALDGLLLERYHPFYAFAIGGAKPTAVVAASARVQRLALKAGSDTGVLVSDAALSFTDLVLPASAPGQRGKARSGKPLLALKTFAVSGASVDVDKRDIFIDQINSSDAELRVERAATGKIDLLEALDLGNAREQAAKPEMAPLTAKVASTAGEWQVRSGKVDISKWNVLATDRTGKTPVSLAINNMGLTAEGFSTAKGNRGKFDLSAELNRKGRIRLAGQASAAPLAGQVKVDARSVDLVFTQPYLSSVLRVLLTQGTLDARGDASFDLSNAQVPKFSYDGDVLVSKLNSFDLINDADFLRWKTFSLKRVQARSEPLALSIGEVRLEDFYTRLILDAQGRFNLREMTRREEEALSVPPTSASAPAASSSSRGRAVAVLPAAEKPLNVRVDRAVFSGGNVNFSDRFIKPNYDANLTDVAGSLNGLSPDPNSLAELSLKALVDRSAPVEVSGQLNPLRQDKYLDIKAKVTGVDLTGVSPYAARYVGYGISKGKLSMDVNYRIRDRKLTAENKVFLDQLTFGDRIESPDATKLPVLLAVALLKDRNGVIDLNMPISGTLDDPEFSVGGIIVRVLVNLITKAVTAPFALLGSMFGGGEELSYLDFNAGLAILSKPAEEKLTTLARALTDRPALNLEITGNADPVADITGLKQASLNSRLRALKAEAMVRRGESVGEVDALAIPQEEYADLLEKVYRAATFDKPKNAIGMTKGLPVPEMEKLLFDNTKVGEADLRSLANSRAQAVRNWLTGQGKIPPARLFVLEGKIASEATGKQPAMRVDFSLK